MFIYKLCLIAVTVSIISLTAECPHSQMKYCPDPHRQRREVAWKFRTRKFLTRKPQWDRCMAIGSPGISHGSSAPAEVHRVSIGFQLSYSPDTSKGYGYGLPVDATGFF